MTIFESGIYHHGEEMDEFCKSMKARNDLLNLNENQETNSQFIIDLSYFALILAKFIFPYVLASLIFMLECIVKLDFKQYLRINLHCNKTN